MVYFPKCKTTARPWPDQGQEPVTQSPFPMGMTGANIHEPKSADSWVHICRKLEQKLSQGSIPVSLLRDACVPSSVMSAVSNDYPCLLVFSLILRVKYCFLSCPSYKPEAVPHVGGAGAQSKCRTAVCDVVIKTQQSGPPRFSGTDYSITFPKCLRC